MHQLQRDRDFSIDEKAKSASLTEEGGVPAGKSHERGEPLRPAVCPILSTTSIRPCVPINFFAKGRRLHRQRRPGSSLSMSSPEGLWRAGVYSEGLHQALEAKEKREDRAGEPDPRHSPRFQNYFRMYKKLAGMTGTADTEAVEFKKIYNLDVVVIPTNRSLIRLNHPDVVYRTEKEKFKAAINEIEELYKKGQAGPCRAPCLSINRSEFRRCSNARAYRTIS